MKVLGNVLATIVSIIYSFVLFAMMILAFASNVFSANYYEAILTDIDISEIKLADFGITLFKDKFGEDATIEDILVQTLEETGISKNDALKIVNNEKVNEIVGTFVSDTVEYITNNEEIPQINYQDVEEIIKSNEISSVLENAPKEEEIKQVVDELNKFITESLKEGI